LVYTWNIWNDKPSKSFGFIILDTIIIFFFIQKKMNIYIKNMVSLNSQLIVKKQLEKSEIPYLSVDSGLVKTKNDLSKKDLIEFGGNLKKVGLILLDDKKSILIDKIKNVVIELVQSGDESPKVNYSVLISERLGYDYGYISSAFSKFKGLTIQQFIAFTKIERVKELLLNNDLGLKDIAVKMKYSNVSQLSKQFKMITGMSPDFYKKIIKIRRENLHNI
jgi:AraC-like DNA-binding protein